MTSTNGKSRAGGVTTMSFGIGLIAGAALGVGLVLLAAPTMRKALRKDIVDRARTATTAGLREVRRNWATPTDPRRSDLAGADGLLDVVDGDQRV